MSISRRHTRIMVVDASEVSRTIISRILDSEMEHASIISCGTAAEAIEHLGQWDKFDLITTSLMLPDMDGLDLCRRIRSTEAHHYTPVVVVSGDADDRLLREGFDAGVTDYFDKSRGYKEFVEFVHTFMQRNAGMVGRILYVEDSPTAATITRRIMEKHGLKVAHVASAEQALTLLEGLRNGWLSEDDSFDIIVTDFYLKGSLTGGDLLHAIRTRLHYSPQEMPVLVITVADNKDKQAEIFHAGANDFVPKPLFEEIFIARVRSLLLIKRQFVALRRQAEEMRRLATTDSLTGVRSRRYLLERGEQFIKDRGQESACVMIMDIDHFKQVNDNYGHLTGDHVLAAIGEHLNNSFPDDMVVRFGGEEFCVLFRGFDTMGGYKVAEELRTAIEALKPAKVPATLSIGMVCTDDYPAADLTRLLAMADEALYAAKARGRNRVFTYTSEGPEELMAVR